MKPTDFEALCQMLSKIEGFYFETVDAPGKHRVIIPEVAIFIFDVEDDLIRVEKLL